MLIQNLKPGSMDKLGFALARLRKDYPALICCTISGYGDDGPYADRKAYDLLIQAESGLASITGGPDGPSRVGMSIVDIATGATAHAAILEALIGALAQRPGRRHPHLDVRRDGRLAGGAAAQRRSRQSAAADGPGASLDRALWRVSLEGRQGHPDLDPERARMEETVRRRAGPARRCRTIRDSPTWSSGCATAQLTDKIVGDSFATMTRDELLQRLSDADIAFAEVNTMADLAVHPHLRRIEVETPAGPVSYPAPAAIVVGEPRHYGAVPGIGEHTPETRRKVPGPHRHDR